MGHGYSGDVNPLVLTVAGHRRVRWRRAARAPDTVTSSSVIINQKAAYDLRRF